MLREPFSVGSYVHVIKRGARGITIFQDDMDRWRSLLMFRHFNDAFHSDTWFRDLMDEKLAHTLVRPLQWPAQRKIVSIVAFTLMPNHLHLILQEIKDGGIATFMGKLGKGIVLHANEKYSEQGSLFQGPYRSRTITEDIYFKCVCMYVMVKNTFELYPGGYARAVKNFDDAYEWATQYLYGSLMDYHGKRDSGIIDSGFVRELFPSARSFKSFARDYIEGRIGSLVPDEKTFE